MRRAAGLSAIVVTTLVLVLTARPASAQAVPTVRIAGTTAMTESEQCFTEPVFGPGSFTLERSSATGTLEVTFHISGGPTDLNSDAATGADHTATFATGQAQITVTVHPALGGGQATVALADGAAYDLGSPSTATIQKSLTSVDASTCLSQTPPTTTPPPQSRALARTGSASSTFGLFLIGLGMIVAGMAMKRVAGSRVR
jgi:hypothetical protein